ncbi:membrane protein insertase YidC [Lacticigenium naphthae]|uniref:membrane protein insertase YidC n=1 Tax=Lacticigenium naphthae TaxID=515351 RepID=UPI00040735C3|nr:membrane protein insertase YidC [Lacticigenium naphthae]
MKKRTKKLLLSTSLLSLMLFLSGCMRFDDSGDPTGFVYDNLVVPTQEVIIWLADSLGGSFGLAIIVITIVVRLTILPLGLSQQKKTTTQQVKMGSVKHITDEIQAEMKAAQTPEEKQELQKELMQVYSENNINPMGGIGCLPLLIQLPIFTAMFQAINLSQEIAQSTFFGISLGERSILLAVLAGAVYYLQSRVMMAGMSEEQKQQSKTMMLLSPVMILFFSLTGPAGLSLYWLAGGIVAIIQSYITNNYYKPKIEADIREKQGDTTQVTRKKSESLPKRKDVTPPRNKRNAKSTFETKDNSKGRNAGKQQKNK